MNTPNFFLNKNTQRALTKVTCNTIVTLGNSGFTPTLDDIERMRKLCEKQGYHSPIFFGAWILHNAMENKMTVRLIVEAETNEMPWQTFMATKPPFSIAVDGVVPEGPTFDEAGPHMVLNHHEKVPRLETRASCAQARYHVQQGLFDRFRNEGEPHALIWANDCDHDVCLTWTIFSQPDVLRSEDFLRLLDIVDMRDTCGGFCAPPLRPEDGETLAWVFGAYQNFRTSGGLAKRHSEDFVEVVLESKRRMLAYLDGRGEKLEVDYGYRKISGGRGWAMVEESSTDARMQMHADGIRVFVSARHRFDGLWTIQSVAPQQSFRSQSQTR